MRLLSLKGYLAQRHAIKQMLANTALPEEKKPEIEYVVAHYTVMGLSFAIKFTDGKMIQEKVAPATPQAIAEMFAKLGG